MGFHRSNFSKLNTEFNSDLAPCDFWAFPPMKRMLRCKKFRSYQRSAACFREMGGALSEAHRLPKEVLGKRDRHRTSTKFRLRVIRWVHELCKRPSYIWGKSRWYPLVRTPQSWFGTDSGDVRTDRQTDRQTDTRRCRIPTKEQDPFGALKRCCSVQETAHVIVPSVSTCTTFVGIVT
jgi:hypothetical protein